MSLTTVLLRDENTAGGATATDGSARTIVDTNGKLSFASGLAYFTTGGAAAGNPGVWYPIQTRTAGLVFIAQLNQSSAGLAAGFDSNQSGALNDALSLNGTSLQIISNGTTITIGTISLSTDYIAYVVLRATGLQAFLKGGAFTYPTLFYIGSAGSGNEYPGICALNTTSVGSSDFVRAAGYYLAPPIVSDGFSNNGTSDGLGHAETSGIGSGGSGVAMSGTTWSVSGGKGINTPSLGSELITNGDFSLWSGDNPTGWTVGENGTTTFVTERAANQGYGGGGTGAANLYRNGGSANPTLQQNVLTVGRYYSVSIDRYAITASVSIADASFNFQSAHLIGHRKTLRAGTTGLLIYSQGNPADNTIDNVSCKEIALSDLLSLHTSSTPDVFAGIDITVVSGTQVGLALNWDSSSSPTNGVIAYHDGTNCKLEKCVAGTWTTVVSAAATYSANARIVVSKIGTAYRLYYNNSVVGSGTISDAGIINNTLHGRFNTYEGNTVDNYTAYASGTGGEYDSALQIVLSSERSTSMAMADATTKLPIKPVADTLSLADSVLRTVVKSEAVQMALSSSAVRVPVKMLSDVVSLSDSVLRTIIKSETVQMALDSTAAKVVIKAFSDDISFARSQAINYGKRIIWIIRLLGNMGAD